MATVKTVLVKGRRTQNGRFPLVVQVLHKRKKKVVYTGFSIAESLFDPTMGRVINDGKSDPELIRRINSKCEGISRTLLKSVSMTEKKLRIYEIEDVFKTYGLLTHDTGFYSYTSDKIRELRQSGHEGTARAYNSSLSSMKKILGSRDFPFNKLSSQVITNNCSLREYVRIRSVFTCITSRLSTGKVAGRWGWNCLPRFVRYILKLRKPSNGVWKRR